MMLTLCLNMKQNNWNLHRRTAGCRWDSFWKTSYSCNQIQDACVGVESDVGWQGAGKYDGWGVGGQWPATLVYSEYLSSRWRHWWQPHVATTSGQNVEFHTAHQHQRIFKLSIWRHFRMILADLCSPLLRTNICFFRCHNFTHYSFSTGIQILLLQNRQWWTDSGIHYPSLNTF